MPKLRRLTRRSDMSPDAYAGFLRMLLTPIGSIPPYSEDIDAYLAHLNRVDPISTLAHSALCHATDEAA